MAKFPPRRYDRDALARSGAGLANREFVAFDVETTGENVHVDEPVEIGAVRFDFAGNILDRFEWRGPLPRATGDIVSAIQCCSKLEHINVVHPNDNPNFDPIKNHRLPENASMGLSRFSQDFPVRDSDGSFNY